MRILMLSSSYPKYVGETTAPFIEEIAAALAVRGHTIHMVVPFHPQVQRQSVERGVHLHFYRYAPHSALNVWGYAQSLLGDTDIKYRTLLAAPFALAGSVGGLLGVQRSLHHTASWFSRWVPCNTLHQAFDVLHAHWVIPNGLPAALVARCARLPLVISMHGSDVYLAEQHVPITVAAGIAFRAATAVTACSSDLHRRSIHIGAPADRSHVIPYGINPDEFKPDAHARAAVRAELGITDETPLVLGLGRLVYKKGFSVLLDAWQQVLAHHPTALLVLVGYGDLRESLEAHAVMLNIASRVRFTGALERQRAAAYVAATDVFALPIVHNQGADGLPNVLLEAMSAGRPIVASRVAGVPDVIEHERHGLLVPDRNPTALAAAINRLLNDHAFAETLGQAARTRMTNELTWEQTAIRFEHVYNRVLGCTT